METPAGYDSLGMETIVGGLIP